MSLLDLAEQMNELVAKIAPAANQMAKDVANAILEDLTITTPVDTGTALSNWQVSINAPNPDTILAYNPSKRGQIPPDVTRGLNAGTVLDVGNSVIATKQPGEPLFIANNLPYISILNDGHSQQAPAGFVQRSEVLAQVIIDKGLKIS